MVLRRFPSRRCAIIRDVSGVSGSIVKQHAVLRRYGPLLIVFTVLAAVTVLDALFPPPQPPLYSKQILDRDGELLNAFLARGDKWRLRTRIDHVTPDLIRAIVTKEDRYYLYHPGINPFAIIRAFSSNLVEGRRVSGASTITMQLARMLEPAERSYSAKFREMIRALQLERRYSKRDILEMYLSVLPMGGNIEGVASASWIYFNRPPDKLSLTQCIALAVIPNNPNRYRLDRSSSLLDKEIQHWIGRFRERSVFGEHRLALASEEMLFPARHAMPSRAPHLSRKLGKWSAHDIVHTTLDGEIQNIAENLLRNHVRRVILDGVSNGAVLVLRNDSMEVAAYCGSADFDDVAHQGQVDGVTGLRSPGSVLKPLLFARAFDDGYLTPGMMLLDIPTDFGGYMPENFDATFRGEVAARDALLHSLNIPAVRLLARQGVTEFISFLTATGFSTIAAKRELLGLSLILGGCGVTLEELTRALSMFAREGRLSPLRYRTDDAFVEGTRMFSSASAFLVSDILSKNIRPDLPTELLESTRLPQIAWKTGTSYGKRDAWAVGWNKQYTIAVWMGNFSGVGAPALSGAVMAVPLLVDLFNAIDYDGGDHRIQRPDDVITRDVCVRTGLPPSERCEGIVGEFAIRDVSTTMTCSLMREFFTDEAGRVRYCRECLPSEGAMSVWYPAYDPELILWFRKNRRSVPEPPPHNTQCSARFSDDTPVILSPSSDYQYFIEQGSEQQISLHAAAHAGVRVLYWYVDGEHVGTAAPGEKLFFTPLSTRHRIACMDDAGRRSIVVLNVTYY